MATRAGRCPGCGEPVSPFAAGCAICGHDLAELRRRQATRRQPPQLPRMGPLFATPTSQDAAFIAILALAVVLSPLLCLGLAIFGAIDRNRQGRVGARNAIIAIAVLAAAVMFIPAVRFGLLQLLL